MTLSPLSSSTMRRGGVICSWPGIVDRLFKSLLPDVAANEFGPICKVFSVIAAKIRVDIPAADISEVMDDVAALLDYSIATQGYVIKPSETRRTTST